MLSAILLVLLSALEITAQESIRISGDRLTGVVLPVEPITAPIRFNATRANTWTVDDTKRLLLTGDVRVSIGDFHFSGQQATVWLNRIPSADGLINQVAVYFEEVLDSSKRAGLGAEGSQLLITGSARGEVVLNVALLDERRPGGEAIVAKGETRLGQYLRRVVAGQLELRRRPQIDGVAPPSSPQLEVGRSPSMAADLAREVLPSTVTLPGASESAAIPLFVPDGTVAFTAQQIDIIEGEAENAILVTGEFVLEYADFRGREQWSRLTLTAQRAVVYVDPFPLTDPAKLAEISSGMSAANVRGVYLEGNVVATDGEYTVRGEQVYYDFRQNRAIVLDAVLRTYSRLVNRPVYARAEEMRQVARTEWTAERATISASEFFTPHLSIGARRITVTERPVEGEVESSETFYVSEGNTLRAGNVPLFWWPQLSGTIDSIPLRRIDLGHSDNNGVEVETTWDLFALLGKRRPSGVDVELQLDAFTARGAGGGLRFEYDFSDSNGLIDLYGLFDNGTDRTSAGRDVEQDNEFRGYALWEQRLDLNPTTQLFAQFSYISDESFMTTWRDDDFEQRREYETSLELRDVGDSTAFTALLKYDLHDFLSNEYLLASRQFTVDRVPEFSYRRFNDEIFNGDVKWSSEYRVSRMRFNFEEHSPSELGIRQQGFGLGPDDRFIDRYRGAGFPREYVGRFDTRHEFSIPSRWGAIETTPFLVGRFTAYDNDFEEFSSDADDLRYYGAAGIRFSTTLQRVNNNVESQVFDLHRIRHIVEPSLALWYAYSNVDQSDLPVFDSDVESIATGAAMRLGVRNTWQTQRGGPGRWRSVDFLTIDTGLVLVSGDSDAEGPVPQFFDYRPELSRMGDHIEATAIWELSDTLAVVGETIYDLEHSRVGRGSIGAELRHSPIFTTYVEMRYIDPSDTELLDIGWYYRMTPKYALSVTPQWDLREDEFRSVRLRVIRSFPDFDFVVSIRYDEIQDETQVSASLGRVNF